jgi:hypothetical protein
MGKSWNRPLGQFERFQRHLPWGLCGSLHPASSTDVIDIALHNMRRTFGFSTEQFASPLIKPL